MEIIAVPTTIYKIDDRVFTSLYEACAFKARRVLISEGRYFTHEEQTAVAHTYMKHYVDKFKEVAND